MEKINGTCVINPQSVNSLKGKPVEEKYVIFECDGKQYWALLKWKGIININTFCMGCVIETKSLFGTNGTFVNQSIFKCDDGCGVLIRLDQIRNCCVTEGHRKLSINNNRIDEKTICCIKQSKESKLNIQIKINERIRKINGKETGILKWVGLVNKEEIIGLDSKNLNKEGTDGAFCGLRLFNCDAKCGALFEPTCFECDFPYEQKEIPKQDRIFPDIDINSPIKYYVGLNNDMKELFGTVKWTGVGEDGKYFYGLELEETFPNGTDGGFYGQRLFQCRPGHGILAPLYHVARDSRFIEEEMSPDEIPSSKDSEKIYHGVLAKLIPGPNKGIQSNANSYYFDTAIFALFSTSDVLDYMISPTLNELDKNDITKEFRKIISWKIIYPLREFGFVTFHNTNEMRNVIKKYGPKFEEMVKQESDMENVSKFLAKLCPGEQLLSIISYDNCKSNSMFLQLFLILDRKLEFMTSEEMLKLSMVQNNIMFDELPSCLIMQAPRDAKGNNCYQYVLPNDIIEISDICSNYVKACFKCSKEARFLCKKCMDKNKPEISACYKCDDHKCRHDDVINISNSTTKSKSKVFMELKAIICIEKCHFVAYVKQTEVIVRNKSIMKENRWYLFDSTSYLSSHLSNYPVPKVSLSEEVTHFLNMSQDQMKMEIKNYGVDNIRRIVLDSYIFVYHNPAKTCY